MFWGKALGKVNPKLNGKLFGMFIHTLTPTQSSRIWAAMYGRLTSRTAFVGSICRKVRKQGSAGVLRSIQGYKGTSLIFDPFTVVPPTFDLRLLLLLMTLTCSRSRSSSQDHKIKLISYKTTDFVKASSWWTPKYTQKPMFKSPGPYPQQQCDRNKAVRGVHTSGVPGYTKTFSSSLNSCYPLKVVWKALLSCSLNANNKILTEFSEEVRQGKGLTMIITDLQ